MKSICSLWAVARRVGVPRLREMFIKCCNSTQAKWSMFRNFKIMIMLQKNLIFGFNCMDGCRWTLEVEYFVDRWCNFLPKTSVNFLHTCMICAKQIPHVIHAVPLHSPKSTVWFSMTKFHNWIIFLWRIVNS